MIHHINKIDCVNRFLTERKKIKKGGSPFFFFFFFSSNRTCKGEEGREGVV